MKDIKIKTKNIQLDQFLKWSNLVTSGGEAKNLIQTEKVWVNGEIETHRSHLLKTGDIVQIIGDNQKYRVKGE